jgi:hypothetical protein
MSQENEYKLKFYGEYSQIDANTLANSLLSITTIIQEVNNELATDKKIEIKVKALQKGSFLVHIELIESLRTALTELITRDNIGTAAAVMAITIGILQLRALLKGGRPKNVTLTGDNLYVENNDGKVMVIDNRTYKMYNHNVTIKNSVSKNFETLYSDGSISEFEIVSSDDKTLIKIPRDEFEGMSIKSETIEENRKKISEVATLHIFKLVFDANYKWEFYYKGNRISAKITDKVFYDQIDQGEGFAKGDALEVELQINQIFDSNVNTYINESYEVVNVLKHIPRGAQQKLDFQE